MDTLDLQCPFVTQPFEQNGIVHTKACAYRRGHKGAHEPSLSLEERRQLGKQAKFRWTAEPFRVWRGVFYPYACKLVGLLCSEHNIKFEATLDSLDQLTSALVRMAAAGSLLQEEELLPALQGSLEEKYGNVDGWELLHAVLGSIRGAAMGVVQSVPTVLSADPTRLDKLKEMACFMELMNANGLNFSKPVLATLDWLHRRMKDEWNNPLQNKMQTTELAERKVRVPE